MFFKYPVPIFLSVCVLHLTWLLCSLHLDFTILTKALTFQHTNIVPFMRSLCHKMFYG